MDSPPDSAFLQLLHDYVWAPILGLIGILATAVHGNLNEKISNVKAVADNAVQQRVFDAHLADQREYRQNRERIDARLFESLDDLKDLIIQQNNHR